ncbi:MAG: tetratricopeptide repeat protein [Burkholderiales bacterium]|nr:tetratricopeptide repeat protein [Anaerolineae bacterium]
MPLLVISMLLLFAASAYAQDDATDEPAQTAVETLSEEQLTALVERIENAADSAQSAAEESRGAVDLGFNLLGLFEVFGGLISILAIVGGAVAVRQLQSLQNKVDTSLERFEKDLTEAKQRFEIQLKDEEKELTSLRDQLQQKAEEQRTESSQATQALSVMTVGERQYKAGDLAGTLETYRRALSLDADSLVVHYRLGYVYTQMGELEQAENHLMKALDIDAAFAPALASLGYVYRRMAEKMPESKIERGIMLARAEEKLRQALTLLPRLVDDDGESWWGSLGGLHRRRGQIDDAIDAYKRAAEVTSQSSYPYSNLALLYLMKGEYGEMISTYARVEKLAFREVLADVDNYWAYADLLTARLAQGKVAESEEALESVFSTAPVDSPYALESLLDTLGRLAGVLKTAAPDSAKLVQGVIDRIQAYRSEAANVASNGNVSEPQA